MGLGVEREEIGVVVGDVGCKGNVEDSMGVVGKGGHPSM